jgi:CRISPR/Cas system-associated exonuclease Cas4 (RecB family)
MIGNVIHKINEDYTNGKITSENEFEEKWKEHESYEYGRGLKSIVRNYGVFKSLTKSNIIDVLIKGAALSNTRSKFQFKSERFFKDEVNDIQGRLDLLILKEGRPVEIRDYKTGNIYNIDAKHSFVELTGSSEDYIKEDYKKQLLLYAWLVKQKYNSFPEKLTIVTNDGELHYLEFTEADIYSLIGEINKLRSRIKIKDTYELANPTMENCKYCNFRFGCEYKISPNPDPIGDVSGIITGIKRYPYGNMEVQLNNIIRIVFPSKEENIDKYDCLINQYVIFTFLRAYYHNKEIPSGSKEFYVPTKLTELVKMI